MQFDDLKQIMVNSGERLILVENGKPCCVLLSFADYRKLANQQQTSACYGYEEIDTAKPVINQGIQLPASNYIAEPVKPTTTEEIAAKELKLEDLPF